MDFGKNKEGFMSAIGKAIVSVTLAWISLILFVIGTPLAWPILAAVASAIFAIKVFQTA